MKRNAKELVLGLAWGGGIIVLALAATLLRATGYVDQETVTRVVIGTIGLMIAWYGNRMPKALAPSADARKLARVGGWSLALSGLVYAAAWAFAPIPTASAASPLCWGWRSRSVFSFFCVSGRKRRSVTRGPSTMLRMVPLPSRAG